MNQLKGNQQHTIIALFELGWSKRNITSNTRPGAPCVPHSKNRSQSAVSEPTRLSVPFEAMSSALNQKSWGISAL